MYYGGGKINITTDLQMIFTYVTKSPFCSHEPQECLDLPDRLGVGDGLNDLVRRDDAVGGRGHQAVQPLANLKYFQIMINKIFSNQLIAQIIFADPTRDKSASAIKNLQDSHSPH